MSVKYLAWALDLEMIDTAHKMVLVVLANRANDDGECWPGQASIARQASMSDRSVRRKLEALERAGYIHRHRRGGEGSGRVTDLYVLDMEATGQIDQLPATGQSGQATGQNGHSNRPRVSDKPSVEPSVEPSELSPASPSGGWSMATVAQVQYLRDLHMLMGGWRNPDVVPGFTTLFVDEAGLMIREALECLAKPEYRDPPPEDHPVYAAMSGDARSLMGRWKVVSRDRARVG